MVPGTFYGDAFRALMELLVYGRGAEGTCAKGDIVPVKNDVGEVFGLRKELML